jgi:hypothetical protein
MRCHVTVAVNKYVAAYRPRVEVCAELNKEAIKFQILIKKSMSVKNFARVADANYFNHLVGTQQAMKADEIA